MADEVTSLDGASLDELIDLLRKTPGHLFKTAADSLAYLAAQDGLLSEAQEERDRARDELAETKRPLAEEMARLNRNLTAANIALADRDRRIEALTKALRELVEAGDEIEANAMDESSQAYIDARMRYIAAFHACKALASAAGAEVPNA